jgi:hypothetical protein
MSIYSQSQELSDMINYNLRDLKRSLNKAGLVLSNMKLFAKEKDDSACEQQDVVYSSEVGFNLKV